MPALAIIYHSGYGHTARVAQAVAEGAAQVSDAHVHVCSVDALTERDWQALDAADAIIFGAPTYMGGVSAPFKSFMDGTSKRWRAQAWKDKLAAGFTNSGAYDGDKLGMLTQLCVFAMQHSMLWVGTGMMSEAKTDSDVLDGHAINRLGSFMGLTTQSGNAPPEVTPPPGDIATARLFGQRVAETAARLK